ncbi:MAG: CDP-alcohol phosphatidyltransferase family protein [Eubacteriales bacterium]
MRTKVLFNVPNLLTLLRFIMVPFAVLCAVKHRFILGFIIYMSACATDVLDGYIARKFNLVSDEGKLLDPLADKVMIMAMVITFTVMGLYTLAMLLIILAKELLMIIGAIHLYRRDVVVQANWSGKSSALLTHVSIGLAFLSFFYHRAYYYVMMVAITATLISLVQYVYIYFFRKKSDGDKEAEPKTN